MEENDVETIKFSRIEAAANGEIPEDELTEMEIEFVKCYLRAYDRACAVLMSHFEEQVHKAMDDFQKSSESDDIIDVEGTGVDDENV